MNKSENQLIAARYAKSLLELNTEGGLDNAGVYRNLENIKAILKSSNELCEALCNPVISAADKEAVIDAVFEKDTDILIRNFLKLLVKINNISKIEIISAIELDDNFREKIKNRLSEILKKEIIINYNTDESLIAGLVYKMGDDVFDTSLKGKMEKFKNAILK